jgi:DNA-binding response OmpR family regulator
MGHDVRIALNGAAALALAEQFKPQVVLLDIGLPGMSGFELATELRKKQADAALLLIAVTGYGDEDTRERIRCAGFDHHLPKPCGSDELEKLLAAYGRGSN